MSVRGWYVTAAVLLSMALAACLTPEARPQVRRVGNDIGALLGGQWIAIVGQDRPFPFIGEYRDAGTNHGYPMMYPAPDFASFIAGIATHAALQNAHNQARADAQRLRSDEVLAPLQGVIDGIRVHPMFLDALRQHATAPRISMAATASANGLPQVELAAHAILAQSRRALIIDLVARIGDSAEDGDSDDYVHKVRVVSNPIPASDEEIDDYWLADHGQALKETVATLLAQAIDLFVADSTGQLRPLEQKQISARYRFGTERRTERATLLQQTCGRHTLRTLRGWVLSVPVLENPESHGNCVDASVVSREKTPPA